jgi:nicotinate phosphoribosyltransferase
MTPEPSPALLTDLYQLTMTAALVAEGRSEVPATFSMFVRSLPPNRGFLVAAGLDDALRYLDGLAFGPADLAAVAALDLGGGARFDSAYLDWLADLRFTGSVRAVPEGRIVFANEPLLEVTAPLGVAQIAETFLLNQVGMQTTLASKAARYRRAAGGRTLVDFALRRAHGSDAAMKVARSAAIAGFAATSNVAAAAAYGLPATGTMAHSYVLAHAGDAGAFRAFAASSPGPLVLLVDTYDTAEGIDRAVEVGLELEAAGGPRRLAGIRLDSGDLAGDARLARERLDAAGLTRARVLASGGLDEERVAALVAGGAPIDGFGIGTALGVSEDAPVLEIVYKLVEVDGRPVAKRSPGKATLPGAKAVWRHPGFGGDVLALAGEPEPAPGMEGILVPAPSPVATPAEAVRAASAAFEDDWAQLPEQYKKLTDPARYDVALSRGLQALNCPEGFGESTEERQPGT